MKNIKLIPLLFLYIGCTATQKQQQESPIITDQNRPKVEIDKDIDIDLLEQVLKMKQHKENLGYNEKSFNTCKVGSGFKSTEDCKNLIYANINFRLRCRDTEGTTSEIVTEANIRDIENQNIQWKLANEKEDITTSNGGYGSVRGIFKKSPRTDRLILSNGSSFLYLRANEITTVVAPSNWCN